MSCIVCHGNFFNSWKLPLNADDKFHTIQTGKKESKTRQDKNDRLKWSQLAWEITHNMPDETYKQVIYVSTDII